MPTLTRRVVVPIHKELQSSCGNTAQRLTGLVLNRFPSRVASHWNGDISLIASVDTTTYKVTFSNDRGSIRASIFRILPSGKEVQVDRPDFSTLRTKEGRRLLEAFVSDFGEDELTSLLIDGALRQYNVASARVSVGATTSSNFGEVEQ